MVGVRNDVACDVCVDNMFRLLITQESNRRRSGSVVDECRYVRLKRREEEEK